MANTPPDTHSAPPLRLFSRLREKLAATQRTLGQGLGRLLRVRRALDADLLEEIETALLTADVGVETTRLLIRGIEAGLSRKELTDSEAVYRWLRQTLLDLVQPASRPLVIPAAVRPYTIMVVGVNGVGKTTTIGKLAAQLRARGHSVLLAAGDTFRAAAIEQLEAWGRRNDVPVIAQHSGADAAAVAHDAWTAARARDVDVLIVDTAGRQHTHGGLMDELKKIRRVLAGLDPAAPHEVLLILDAGTGQNALAQLEHFGKAVDVTGLVLTKLDGTAKGGILVAIARRSGLPIRFIGVGESVEDLQPFDAVTYVDALLPEE